MGRTDQEFMAGASTAGYPITSGGTMPWLTGFGHLDAGVTSRTPTEVIDVLRRIFMVLGGDESLLRAKRAVLLRPDGFLRGRILEIDEIQHFSTARLAALDLYPDDAPLGYDRDEYRSLCRRWASNGGDRYRANKQTAEFPRCGGRTAQRAYFDALRDLVAPHAGGGPVIRIAAPECDSTLALSRLRTTMGPT